MNPCAQSYAIISDSMVSQKGHQLENVYLLLQ